MTKLEDELIKHDHWNKRLFSMILALHGFPRNYLDVGCGTGAMVKFAVGMGIDAKGLDIIHHPEEYLIHHDLRGRFDFMCEFDLITCVEVAEHIPEHKANNLVESISKHMMQGSVLVWTAATPGQDGINHVNCQLGSYWRDKFYANGLNYRHDYTLHLMHGIQLIPSPSRDFLTGNLQVFEG